MPKFLENALAHEADKKGLIGDAKDRYIWGTMNHMKVVRGNRITPKGEAMEEAHENRSGKVAQVAASHIPRR